MTAFFPRAIYLMKSNPASGATIVIPPSEAEIQIVMVNHAALLALLTISMPTGNFDGQIMRFTFRSPITLLNWAGASVAGSLASALVNGYAAFIWDEDNNTWRRCA